MKKQYRFLFIAAALVAMFVSACGGTATETSAGGDKPRASLVEFTGVIEAIDGNQWTINGQVITVEPAVLRDGPFVVGDKVKVEAEVQADGSVVVTRVEPPLPGTVDDNSNDDNSNANTNTSLDNSNINSNSNSNANTNTSLDNSNINSNSNTNSSIGGNSNDNNSNDDNSSNSNDDNSNDDNDDDNNSNGDDDDDSGDDNSGSGSGDDD